MFWDKKTQNCILSVFGLHGNHCLSSQQQTSSQLCEGNLKVFIMFSHFYLLCRNHVYPTCAFMRVCVCICVSLHCCLFALVSLGWLLQRLKGVHHCLCYLWACFNWAGTADAQSETCSCWLKRGLYCRRNKAVINGIYFTELQIQFKKGRVHSWHHFLNLDFGQNVCLLLLVDKRVHDYLFQVILMQAALSWAKFKINNE